MAIALYENRTIQRQDMEMVGSCSLHCGKRGYGCRMILLWSEEVMLERENCSPKTAHPALPSWLGSDLIKPKELR